MEEICPICGDELSKHYSHKLNCGHIFHYECLFKAFKCVRTMIALIVDLVIIVYL